MNCYIDLEFNSVIHDEIGNLVLYEAFFYYMFSAVSLHSCNDRVNSLLSVKG